MKKSMATESYSYAVLLLLLQWHIFSMIIDLRWYTAVLQDWWYEEPYSIVV